MGLLSNVSQRINVVNAILFAKEREIALSNVHHASSTMDYANYLKVTLKGRNQEETTIGGTIFGKVHLRIIEINGFYLEGTPKGRILVLENQDVPGVIGKVGTLLGQHRVNISEYRLAKKHGSTTALAFINVDSDISEPAIQSLLAFPEIVRAKPLKL